MSSQKFIVGGIIGGIATFFLGYLFYGTLFSSYFDAHATTGPVDMTKMVWWAMIAGNLCNGLLLAYVFGKANVSSVSGGGKVGFILGLLMALATSLIGYSLGKGMNDLTSLAADVILFAIMYAIAGALVGWYGGMKKPASA